MKTEETGIYIDLKMLHKLLYKAQFTMTKGDRIVMGNRLLDLNQSTVSYLSRAVNAKDYDERLYYINKTVGEFDAFRLNMQTAVDLHMFKEKQSTVDRDSGIAQNPRSLVLQMFERIAKADEGMEKWRFASKSRASSNKKNKEGVRSGEVKGDGLSFTVTK